MEQIDVYSDESGSENTLYNFQKKTSKLFLNQSLMLYFLHSINKHLYLIEIKTKNFEFENCVQLFINNDLVHIEYEKNNEFLIIKSEDFLCRKDTIMIKHIKENNQMTDEFDLCLTLINFNSDEYLLYAKSFYEINKFYQDNVKNLDDSIAELKEIESNRKENFLKIPTKYISINPLFNQLFYSRNIDIFNFDYHITNERLSLLKEVNEFVYPENTKDIFDIIGPMGIGKSASLSLSAFYLKHCLKRNCFYFNFGRFKLNDQDTVKQLNYELVVFLYEQIKNNPETNLFTLVEYLEEHIEEPFFISLVKLAKNFAINKLIIVLDQLNVLDEDSLQYLGIKFLVNKSYIKKIFCNSNNNKGVRAKIEMGLLNAKLIASRITKELNRCYSDDSFKKFMIENKLKITNGEGENDTYEFIKKHTNYNPFLYSQIGEKLKSSKIDKNGYLILFAEECETLFNGKCKKFYENNVKDSEKHNNVNNNENYNMFYELVHVFVDEKRQMTCSQLKRYFPVFDCKLFYLEGTNGVIFNIADLKEDNNLFYIKGICPYIKSYYCNLFINEKKYLDFLMKMFYTNNTNPSVQGFYYEQIFKEVVSTTINHNLGSSLCIDKKLNFEISKKLTPYSFISLNDDQLSDIKNLEHEKSIFISPFQFKEKYFDAYIIRKNMSDKFDLFMLSVTISDSHDIVGITELQKCDSLLNKLNENDITLENVYVYYIGKDYLIV